MTSPASKETGRSDLEERVLQFNTMSLPGQPLGMHMGTSNLVNDLWREIQRLRAVNAHDNARRSLQIAIEHIEHMGAFIAANTTGYSFESLGEDMPGLRATLSRLQSEGSQP